MNMKPSRHVTRAQTIRFDGSPSAGRIDVRCRARQNFTLLRTSAGWVVALGEGFQRMVHPKVKANTNPYIVYLRAVKAIWGEEVGNDGFMGLGPALL